MTHLIVAEGAALRAATPVDIFRHAAPLCGHDFPQPCTLRSEADISEFTRWCLTPLKKPTVLLIAQDRYCQVRRYVSFPQGDEDKFWDTLVTLGQTVGEMQSASPELVRFEIVSALPAHLGLQMSEFDYFGNECMAYIRDFCREDDVSYLRVAVSDRLPKALHTHFANRDTSLLMYEGFDRCKVNAEEVARAAMMQNARRLRRGQRLCCLEHSREILQMQVAPLYTTSLGAVLIDSKDRLLDYRHLCEGDLTKARDQVAALVEYAKAISAQYTVLTQVKPCPQARPESADVTVLNQMVAGMITRGCMVPAYWTLGYDALHCTKVRIDLDLRFNRETCSVTH